MNRLYRRNEMNDIFEKFANGLGLKFYSDFSVDYLKYKGLFEDLNDNGNIVVRFDLNQDEFTDEVIRKIMDSVRDTFGKEDEL